MPRKARTGSGRGGLQWAAPAASGGLAASVLALILHRVRAGNRAALDAALLEAAAELLEAHTEEAVARAHQRAARRLGQPMSTVDRARVATLARLADLAMRRVELGSREESLSALVEQTSDVILVVDDRDRIRYASPSSRTLFGTSVLADVPVLDLIDTRERRSAEYLLHHARRPGPGSVTGGRADLTTRGVDGRTAQVEATCRDLRADDAVRGVVLTLRDVTGQRRLERQLTEQAYRDQLTGLPNRLSFRDRTSQALASDAGLTGVLLVDVDRFRTVNEGLGRETGDRVLIGVARRLCDVAGAGHVAARLGGDEFAVLVPHAADTKEINDVAARIVRSFREPLSVAGDAISCGVSVGVATATEASTEEELLRHADLALDAAKASGRGRWRHYRSSMVHAVRFRQELQSALRHALHDGSLIVEYQPIVVLSTSRTIGFEALVRWHHPTRGRLSPAEFIDIAEESELIVPLGEHVLATAIRAARTWTGAGGPDAPYVSVNVSVRQFRSEGFVDTVESLLSAAELPPQQLVLEVTESLLLRDDDEVWQDLKRLRDIGVRIAIDDFGTGYSALGYLRQVPLDIVKLDRLFVSTMATSRRQRELVRGIVGLIRTLRLDVVAEGIETQRQREICEAIGCRYGQGFLFSRSMPEGDALHWLANAGYDAQV